MRRKSVYRTWLVLLLAMVPGCPNNAGGDPLGVMERTCCCVAGCPQGNLICFAACTVFGGVCNDPQSDLRQSCRDSTLFECACAIQDESPNVEESTDEANADFGEDGGSEG